MADKSPFDTIRVKETPSEGYVSFLIPCYSEHSYTTLFDEALNMLINAGLEGLMGDISLEYDDDETVELASIDIDYDGLSEDGFVISYEHDMLNQLKIKYK